jgi:DNA helicase HerA-like ATPase
MIDKDNKINLENEFFGQKTIIVSKSGYGKSYTARVIIEDGAKQGATFIIIDPQDAYLNLENFMYIDGADVKSAKGLGILLSQTNKNVVISTKRLSIENQNKLVGVMLQSYKQNVRKGIQTFVIDEMHKFAPNSGNTDAKEVIRSFFQENRSDGVGMIGVTQRPARIDTTILSQADNLFLGRVNSLRDKQALGNYLTTKEEVENLANLEKGEFYLVLDSLETPTAVKIRKSKTFFQKSFQILF